MVKQCPAGRSRRVRGRHQPCPLARQGTGHLQGSASWRGSRHRALLHGSHKAEVEGLGFATHEVHKIGDAYARHMLIHHVAAGCPACTSISVRPVVARREPLSPLLLLLAINRQCTPAVTSVNQQGSKSEPPESLLADVKVPRQCNLVLWQSNVPG